MDYGHTQNNSITTSSEHGIANQQPSENIVNPFKEEDNLNTGNFNASTAIPSKLQNNELQTTGPVEGYEIDVNLPPIFSGEDNEPSNELGKIIDSEPSKDTEVTTPDFAPPTVAQDNLPNTSESNSDIFSNATKTSGKNVLTAMVEAVIDFADKFGRGGDSNKSAADYYEEIRIRATKYQSEKEKRAL